MALRLFLVEDNQLNCELARDLLELRGHAVSIAMNGEAFRKLLREGEVPDLILMDILLPDSDGVTLLSELRTMEKFSQVPVIALTAQALFGDAERFLGAGFHSVLTKPINTRTFVDDIERWAKDRA